MSCPHRTRRRARASLVLVLWCQVIGIAMGIDPTNNSIYNQSLTLYSPLKNPNLPNPSTIVSLLCNYNNNLNPSTSSRGESITTVTSSPTSSSINLTNGQGECFFPVYYNSIICYSCSCTAFISIYYHWANLHYIIKQSTFSLLLFIFWLTNSSIISWKVFTENSQNLFSY